MCVSVRKTDACARASVCVCVYARACVCVCDTLSKPTFSLCRSGVKQTISLCVCVCVCVCHTVYLRGMPRTASWFVPSQVTVTGSTHSHSVQNTC